MEKLFRCIIERGLIRKTLDIIGKEFNKGIRFIDKFFALIVKKCIGIFTSVDEQTILFCTFRGTYDCNAKAIANEIIRQELPYKLVWVIKKDTPRGPEYFPQNMELVTRGSYKMFLEAAKAKIIFDNSINLPYMHAHKKKTQTFIETWHGSIGIKRISADRVLDKKWVRIAKKTGKITDYCISNSTFEDMVYREDYWTKTPILKYGHARNDILCLKNPDLQTYYNAKIRNAYNIDKNVYICLYAPTFRDDKSFAPYDIDYEMLRDALTKRFGGEWCILVRFHFQLLKFLKKERIELPDFVINVSNYDDIQDLLSIVDVGITDFSSWICDYMLTKRPGFLFAPDAQNYVESGRGVYYPLETLPFPLAEDNDTLVKNILNFNQHDFENKAESFLQEKGCIDDGHAAERIVAKVKEIMEGCEK